VERCGDLWCFHPAAAEGDQVPVALCPHDEMQAEIFAPDLAGFWFRQLLQAFAEMDVAHTRYDEAKQLEEARAEIRTIARYVRPEWVAVLARRDVHARPVTTRERPHRRVARAFDAPTRRRRTERRPRARSRART
jgi:hypothetical protein